MLVIGLWLGGRGLSFKCLFPCQEPHGLAGILQELLCPLSQSYWQATFIFTDHFPSELRPSNSPTWLTYNDGTSFPQNLELYPTSGPLHMLEHPLTSSWQWAPLLTLQVPSPKLWTDGLCPSNLNLSSITPCPFITFTLFLHSTYFFILII